MSAELPAIRLRALLCLLTFATAFYLPSGKAQSRTTSIGICYRPVFPVAFLGTGEERVADNGVDFSLGLDQGFSGGMVVRRGWTDLLSIEVGINYVKRNYRYSISDSSYSSENRFRLIGYELPISLLAFVRLGDELYMNASLGAGLDAYASSVATKDDLVEQVAIKKHTLNPSLNANLGWEYRFPGSGTVYLGATYHRPFQDIYVNSVLYDKGSNERVFTNLLSGSYLTADIRYYFKGEKDSGKKKQVRKKK